MAEEDSLRRLQTDYIDLYQAHSWDPDAPLEETLRAFDDIRAIVDGQSQADPQFRTRRLYTRLTAGEARRQLIAQRGYTDAELPCERTIATKLNALGYTLTKVAKTQLAYYPPYYDDGDTQTDSLALERQRGITIKSAVVSFIVDDVTVNLIDARGSMDGRSPTAWSR